MSGTVACVVRAGLALVLVTISAPLAGQSTEPPLAPCGVVETTADMRACLRARLQRAEDAMALALTGARERANLPATLDSAQIVWLEYRRVHCRAVAAQFDGGSLQPVLLLQCLETKTRDRTRELMDLFKESP